MKVIFISRAYPPTIGGIEKQNFEIGCALSELADVKIIANTRGKKFLPLFLFFAFFKALFFVRSYDVILLGDGLLSVPGWILKKLSGKPVVSIVHGLDITFSSSLYQKLWVRFALCRLDALFAVGHETIRQAVNRGVKAEKCVFIPNGVEPVNQVMGKSEAVNGLNLKESRYLLTLGRLVKRKGVAWFIKEVMPSLPDDVIYLVAGDGVEKQKLEKLVKFHSLQDRVILLGKVSELEKVRLLYAADIFVQPNIQVDGDIEGFGLVVLEAGIAEMPVVASKLEGLNDAIKHNENGLLVESENAQEFISVLSGLLDEPQKRKELGKKSKIYIESSCLWSHVARSYNTELLKLL